MNPPHLKLLWDWSDLYRHLITLALAQHGPAQRGFAADDLNEHSAADQLHAAPVRAEKEVLLVIVGIDQADQRAELYTFCDVVGTRAELAPIGQRLADGIGAPNLAGGQVGGFESQCVVFVFGDVFFVGRRLMGRPHCLFGLQQVFGQPCQHLLLQQEFIHDGQFKCVYFRPKAASIALPSQSMSSLPHSPAADRNKEPILQCLHAILRKQGTALEVAAGTGQHAIWFAAALPGWKWQPTDADAAMLPVMAARIAEAGLDNVLAPLHLDVTEDWPPLMRTFDAIYCANMLHIAPWDACAALMAGAARHLAPGGVLVTYGPYFEKGVSPSPGNLAFDASLRDRDPGWGIRNLEDVSAEAGRAGLILTQRHEMPSNNLLLVFRPESVE